MNYQLIYNNLIMRAKIRNLEGYSEKHHIIPKCLGGSNHRENLIKLTAREHFIAHRLLCKIYPKEGKLKNALWRFIHGNSQQKLVSSKSYQVIKKQCVEVWREKSKQMMMKPEFKKKCFGFKDKDLGIRARALAKEIFKTDEFKVRKIASCKKAWRESRELIPVKVYKAIQTQKPNHGKPAIWIKGDYIGTYDYAKLASKALNVTETKICKVMQGIRAQSNGFIFERVHNEKKS